VVELDQQVDDILAKRRWMYERDHKADHANGNTEAQP